MSMSGTIAQALQLRCSGRVHVGSCPACGYKGAFTVQDRNGRTLVHCHAGCDQDAVLAALRSQGLWGGGDGPAAHRHLLPRSATVRAPGSREGAADAAYLKSLWRAALPAPGTGAEAYLRSRSITLALPPVLRFMPELRHKPTGTAWPAMLAVIQDVQGRAVGLHRTYLRPDGSDKAPINPVKMALGRIAGAAVRLAAAGPHLIIGEGIENTLSAMQGAELPGWAALSCGGICTLILPPLPLAAIVTIAADNDDGGIGRAAAFAAADRWHREGRSVRIAFPQLGCDFNDMLQNGGGHAS